MSKIDKMLEDDYIIDPQKREDIENDILFKFNYGTNMETPSNFKKKTTNQYDYEDLFYNIKYNKVLLILQYFKLKIKK